MMQGTVTAGEPVVTIRLAGHDWPATIDTGFNRDLELPEILRPHVNARFVGFVDYVLGGGQVVREENYQVDFPFAGQIVSADASFVVDADILIGTEMLTEHRLEINFRAGTVLLERVP